MSNRNKFYVWNTSAKDLMSVEDPGMKVRGLLIEASL